MEDLPKHRALTAPFGSAGAMLLVFALAGLLAATGPQDSVAAISRRTESAPPSGSVLAQTDLPPPGSDLEKEEEDWAEEPADTLSPPQGFTPPPSSPAAAADSTLGAAADSTLGATADSTRAATADSTRGVTADSTGRAVMIPAAPAIGDTVRYVPGVTNTQTPAPKPVPTQPERKGLFGLHPAAIAFGLVLAHYFIVKAATD